ncbi:MAG: hypothetical protein ACI8TX_002182 [Hyphomicrobiaceae bacterium]|jgi:hypothetical protein
MDRSARARYRLGSDAAAVTPDDSISDRQQVRIASSHQVRFHAHPDARGLTVVLRAKLLYDPIHNGAQVGFAANQFASSDAPEQQQVVDDRVHAKRGCTHTGDEVGRFWIQSIC